MRQGEAGGGAAAAVVEETRCRATSLKPGKDM